MPFEKGHRDRVSSYLEHDGRIIGNILKFETEVWCLLRTTLFRKSSHDKELECVNILAKLCLTSTANDDRPKIWKKFALHNCDRKSEKNPVLLILHRSTKFLLLKLIIETHRNPETNRSETLAVPEPNPVLVSPNQSGTRGYFDSLISESALAIKLGKSAKNEAFM